MRDANDPIIACVKNCFRASRIRVKSLKEEWSVSRQITYVRCGFSFVGVAGEMTVGVGPVLPLAPSDDIVNADLRKLMIL